MSVGVWRRLRMMRDHRWAQPRISEYVDGELPARAHRRLAAHEEACPECAELIAALQELIAALPGLRLPPEATLAIAEETAEQVRARIEEWS